MFTVTYDPMCGMAVPDGRVEEEYQELRTVAAMADGHACFSTENIFTRIRVGIKRREILISEFRFSFAGETIYINPDGTLDTRPTGFHDQHEKFLKELLG